MGVVWFKRDLRLLDHEPLVKAINLDQNVCYRPIVAIGLGA